MTFNHVSYCDCPSDYLARNDHNGLAPHFQIILPRINEHIIFQERPCTTTHRVKKVLSICQFLPCLDLVSFPVLSHFKPQAPLLNAKYRMCDCDRDNDLMVIGGFCPINFAN